MLDKGARVAMTGADVRVRYRTVDLTFNAGHPYHRLLIASNGPRPPKSDNLARPSSASRPEAAGSLGQNSGSTT